MAGTVHIHKGALDHPVFAVWAHECSVNADNERGEGGPSDNQAPQGVGSTCGGEGGAYEEGVCV